MQRLSSFQRIRALFEKGGSSASAEKPETDNSRTNGNVQHSKSVQAKTAAATALSTDNEEPDKVHNVEDHSLKRETGHVKEIETVLDNHVVEREADSEADSDALVDAKDCLIDNRECLYYPRYDTDFQLSDDLLQFCPIDGHYLEELVPDSTTCCFYCGVSLEGQECNGCASDDYYFCEACLEGGYSFDKAMKEMDTHLPDIVENILETAKLNFVSRSRPFQAIMMDINENDEERQADLLIKCWIIYRTIYCRLLGQSRILDENQVVWNAIAEIRQYLIRYRFHFHLMKSQASAELGMVVPHIETRELFEEPNEWIIPSLLGAVIFQIRAQEQGCDAMEAAFRDAIVFNPNSLQDFSIQDACFNKGLSALRHFELGERPMFVPPELLTARVENITVRKPLDGELIERKLGDLHVVCINVKRCLEIIGDESKPNESFLEEGSICQFQDALERVLIDENVIAVSWKHSKNGSRHQGVYEPETAGQTLRRLLKIALKTGKTQHVWMDVYCIAPAKITLAQAFEWMGELYSKATVYPDWVSANSQGITSGWIFQERLLTKLVLEENTILEAIASIFEHSIPTERKDAEDLMDIVRSAIRIQTQQTLSMVEQDKPEAIARMLLDRGENSHELCAWLKQVEHKSSVEVRIIARQTEELVETRKTELSTEPDKLIYFPAKQVTREDIARCVSAMSTTRLLYTSDTDTAYFGVLNARIGADFTSTNLPSPKDLCGRLIVTSSLQRNTSLCGTGVRMNVVRLYSAINLGSFTVTTLGYAETGEWNWLGAGRVSEDCVICAMLRPLHSAEAQVKMVKNEASESNQIMRADLVVFASTFTVALEQMFKSSADRYRLPVSVFRELQGSILDSQRGDGPLGRFVGQGKPATVI